MVSRRKRDSSRSSKKGPAPVGKADFGRRDLLKMGLLATGGYLVAKKASSSPLILVRRRDDFPTSPPTTPFAAPLPIPPTAQNVPLAPAPGEFPVAGEAPRPAHQKWSQFLPQKTYELVAAETTHEFHPDLPAPSTVWSFNGIVPGPLFKANYGEPIVVRFRNGLPTVAQHVGPGRPEISVHLHNGHTASESDGNPADFYATPLFKDNHYPNVLAGFASTHPPNGDPSEAMSTLWYHDHRVEFTSPNVYKGLAGMYLLFDELDTGNELTGLHLPSGEFDVPLFFADKLFDEDGQLFFDTFDFDGLLGDKDTVNGKIQPFFNVARRKYRFRLLNGGPSRFYEFFLSNGLPFIHISNDGNLLPAPIPRQSLRIAVAERVDAILDFSDTELGEEIILQNRLEQVNGRGPTGEILSPGESREVLKFVVTGDAADPSEVPATLRPLPVIDPTAAAATRTWRFERKNGQWAVNGKFFDPNKIRAKPKLNTSEIWILRNESGGWSHPIHIHLEEFRILEINGQNPQGTLVSRKDMAELAPNTEVRVLQHFRDWLGKYPMHCHNTVHEDHAMMVRWDVVP
ncbi:MAG TPA: multicopper oxidase domain-containing protein [Planctomycetota bacterium]|nr:multicopper oxidase domain-containing protein [Planctomycetota bacterium]